MKINVDIKLNDFEGKPIIDGPNGQQASFKGIAINCLNMNLQSDLGKPAEHFEKIYNLLKKVGTSENETDFSLEELKILKDRMAQTNFYTIAKGIFFEILEGKITE